MSFTFPRFSPGPPSAPLIPEFFPESFISVNLLWVPPSDDQCITCYTITLTNITEGNVTYTYSTTTNTTSKRVSDLTRGVDYSFTVAGVDTGGRVGDRSVLAEVITLDSEFSVCHYRLESTNIEAINDN